MFGGRLKTQTVFYPIIKKKAWDSVLLFFFIMLSSFVSLFLLVHIFYWFLGDKVAKSWLVYY